MTVEPSTCTTLAAQIADQVGIKQEDKKYVIRQALDLLGQDRVQTLADEAMTEEIPGKAFYQGLKVACTPEQREELFPPPDEHGDRQERRHPKQRAQFISSILKQIGEKPNVAPTVAHAVKTMGQERIQHLVDAALETEQQGGMMTTNGSRRRTVGGVFFQLLKDALSPEQRAIVFPLQPWSKWKEKVKKRNPDAQVQPPQEKKVPLPWEDRESVIEELLAEEKGQAMMKLSVVGRPHKVLERGTTVVLTMTDKKVPSLPAGLPTPAEVGTTLYTVYIASKQWKKVAQVMDDPEDMLILEGYPQLDEKTHSIAVFVTGAKSKKTEMGKKEKPA